MNLETTTTQDTADVTANAGAQLAAAEVVPHQILPVRTDAGTAALLGTPGRVAALAREMRVRSQRLTFAAGLVGFFWLTFYVGRIAVDIASSSIVGFDKHRASVLLDACLLAPALGFVIWLMQRWHTRRIAREAESLDDVSLVGPLVKLMEADTITERSRIGKAAARLLPKLQSATDLSLDERCSLAAALLSSRDPVFVRAALETVARLRDPYAREPVEQLACSCGLARKNEGIRQLAALTLKQVPRMSDATTQHAELVRPSAPGDAGALLRAASGAHEEAGGELLRPGQSRPASAE